MSNISIQVAGAYKTARTLRMPSTLLVKQTNGYTGFTIKQLSDYELVVLE